jgi:predicted RNase H-like nuclease (RuvC/YqgF family)
MEEMTSQNLISVMITAITVLGSTAAWSFYEKKMKLRFQEDREDERQQHLFRDDLRERVAVLEAKLETSYKEREELQSEIRKLSEATAAMRVEIDFLRKENESLRRQLKNRDA